MKEFAPKIDEKGNLLEENPVPPQPKQVYPSNATLGTKTSKP